MDFLSEQSLGVESEGDIVLVRRTIRDVSTSMGFGMTDVTRIVTAASELARNIVLYAVKGAVTYRRLVLDGREGLEIVFTDDGPGIADIERAMSVGYTSGGGLGLGLPGAKRLMDEIDVRSSEGHGTCITVRKWFRRH
ncbi:MAG: ATP-binding protein [Dehalococcoidia bacterium]|nr:ATP-binding protein [Dehalococcoidia bacterium]